MLNIAEPVPPPESDGTDSGIPAIEFRRIWTEFHPIPELDGIPTDSESPKIRPNSEIPRNSRQLLAIPINSGITSCHHPHVYCCA